MVDLEEVLGREPILTLTLTRTRTRTLTLANPNPNPNPHLEEVLGEAEALGPYGDDTPVRQRVLGRGLKCFH